MKFSSALLAGSFLVAGVSPAYAHITLEYPPSNTTNQKGPSPCGARGPSKPTTFKPGETITVKWTETIPHPGHFRIAFDADGMDDFKDPTSFTDIKSPAVAPILADGVLKHTSGGGKREFAVTLPNVTCTKCTLQLIQVMTDKPPFGPGGGDDFYYGCADIILAGAVSGGDGGAPDAKPSTDAKGSSGGAGGSGAGGTGGSPSAGGSGGFTSTGGNSGSTTGGSSGSTSGGSTGSAPKGGAGGSTSTAQPSNSDSGGCSVGGEGSRPAGWALIALVLGFALRWRRRR